MTIFTRGELRTTSQECPRKISPSQCCRRKCSSNNISGKYWAFSKCLNGRVFVSRFSMIPKKNRLSERDIRKMVRQRGMFFWTCFIVNVIQKSIGESRYGIIFSTKHTKGSVNRNFFRRMFYRQVWLFLDLPASFDLLFIPKKGTRFSHTDSHSIAHTEADIVKLLQKIYSMSTPWMLWKKWIESEKSMIQ